MRAGPRRAIWCDVSAFIAAFDAVSPRRDQALPRESMRLPPAGCWDFDRWLEEEWSAARERAAARRRILEGTGRTRDGQQEYIFPVWEMSLQSRT